MANPELARYHRLVLLPLIGIPPVRAARARATTDADRAELSAALRAQVGGAAVWLLHLALQGAIGFVWWMVAASAALDAQLRSAANGVLWIATGANLVMWAAEWGLVVVAGLRAARGHPYPLTRRERRAARAADDDDPGPPPDWRPLSDG